MAAPACRVVVAGAAARSLTLGPILIPVRGRIVGRNPRAP
jgi:hypothetical protein